MRGLGASMEMKNQIQVHVEDLPDWLPAGWLLEVKTRKSGVSAGQKYKCYIDPSTGLRFPSKMEVLRHLDVSSSQCPMPNKKRCKQPKSKVNHDARKFCSPKSSHNRSNKPNSKAIAQINCLPDWLPHGWIKEIKCRKSQGRVKKDPYYTDPVTGYVFRSRPEVFHYLETGELSRYACRSKKRCVTDIYSSEEFPLHIAVKEPQSLEHTVRRSLLLEYGKGKETDNQSGNAPIPCADNVCSSSFTLLDAETSAGRKGSASETHIVNHFSPTNHEDAKEQRQHIKMLTWHSSDEPVEQLNEKIENLKLSLPEEKQPEPTNEKQLQLANQNSGKKARKRGRPRQRGRRNYPVPSTTRVVKATKSKVVKAVAMPVRASKRLAGLKADLVPVAGIGDRSLRETAMQTDHLKATKDSELSGGSNSASGISQELKAIPLINDRAKSPMSLPFGSSWLDPCLEFAIRTLTGDIPLMEEFADIQNYFHQHFNSVESTTQRSPAPLTSCTSSQSNLPIT